MRRNNIRKSSNFTTLCLDGEKKNWNLSKSRNLECRNVKFYRLVKLLNNLKFYA